MADDIEPQKRKVVSRADALKDGLLTYYTGKPCPKGHLTDRYVSCFGCTTCLADRAKGPYAWLRTFRGGNKAACARYRAENIEKERARARAYRRDGPKKKTRAPRHLRKLSQEDAAQRLRRHETYFRPKLNAKMRVYRRANPDKTAFYNRRWNAANPLLARNCKANYSARKRGAEGNHTAAEVAKLYKMQRGLCAYCKISLKSGYDEDHITPISRGGSNRISNIQLTCKSCNCKKSAKHPIDFAQQIGLLL